MAEGAPMAMETEGTAKGSGTDEVEVYIIIRPCVRERVDRPGLAPRTKAARLGTQRWRWS